MDLKTGTLNDIGNSVEITHKIVTICCFFIYLSNYIYSLYIFFMLYFDISILLNSR